MTFIPFPHPIIFGFSNPLTVFSFVTFYGLVQVLQAIKQGPSSLAAVPLSTAAQGVPQFPFSGVSFSTFPEPLQYPFAVSFSYLQISTCIRSVSRGLQVPRTWPHLWVVSLASSQKPFQDGPQKGKGSYFKVFNPLLLHTGSQPPNVCRSCYWTPLSELYNLSLLLHLLTTFQSNHWMIPLASQFSRLPTPCSCPFQYLSPSIPLSPNIPLSPTKAQDRWDSGELHLKVTEDIQTLVAYVLMKPPSPGPRILTFSES